MSENNNKMTSIARRINFDFWLKQFANFLMIDVVLVVLIAVTFFVWRENALPEGVVVDDRYFTGNEFRQIQYIIETEAGRYTVTTFTRCSTWSGCRPSFFC